MRDRLREALRRSTADYCEVRYEEEDATGFGYRGREFDSVSTSKVAGGIVRACTKGGWGLATFDALADVERKVEEACRGAALVGQETTRLADGPMAEDGEVRACMTRDFRGVPFAEKLALVGTYNDIILGAAPAIETSHVYYSESFRTVHYASTRGTAFTEERPGLSVILVAVARDGNQVQTCYDGAQSAHDYGAVTGLETMAEQTAQRAAVLLKAPVCPAATCTVILDPVMAGLFAHEAFGHLSEADFLYENPKMLEQMRLGRQMGSQQLTIVDDGSRGDRLYGTRAYDDEGTPTQRTYLIKDGVLVGHLHSLETAAKMGAAPTGNARTIDRTVPPIVRMTNTFIEPGALSFDELLKGIDHGIYACNGAGGSTMLEMFTFTPSYGYRIENGQLGELVRDFTLTGNVFETLHHIDGFGNDFALPEKFGGCGKRGQVPLPVTFGGPHIRIRDVVVGGK